MVSKIVKVHTFTNKVEELAIKSLLKENGITYLSKGFANSAHEAIFIQEMESGKGVIEVYEEDKEKAESLIKEFLYKKNNANKAEVEEILYKEAMEAGKHAEEEPKGNKNAVILGVFGVFIAIVTFVAIRGNTEFFNSGDITITNLEGKVNMSNYIRSCYDRGNNKYKLGDYKGAIIEYDRVIEVYPNDAGAYFNRGAAKHYLGDYKGAIVDYEKAIELNPAYKSQLQPLLDEARKKLEDGEHR